MSSSSFFIFGIIAFGVGLVQWLFFRKALKLGFGWVILTAVGGFLGFIVADVVGNSMSYSSSNQFVPFAIWGAVLGLFQAFGLRGSFERSWLWIFGTAAGLGLSFAIGSGSSLFNSPVGGILLLTIGYSFCTGMSILMMKPKA